jgi:hypothetical protein
MDTDISRRQVTQPAGASHQRQLRELHVRLGIVRAAAQVGIATPTFERAMLGLPLRPGTRSLLCAALGPEVHGG